MATIGGETPAAGTVVITYNFILKDNAGQDDLADLASQARDQGGHVLEMSALSGSLTVGFPSDSKASILNPTDKYTVEKNETVKAKQWDGAMWGTP